MVLTQPERHSSISRISELRGFVFCNNCGRVFISGGTNESEDAATERFKALGGPGLDGRGLVSDPHEWDEFEER